MCVWVCVCLCVWFGLPDTQTNTQTYRQAHRLTSGFRYICSSFRSFILSKRRTRNILNDSLAPVWNSEGISKVFCQRTITSGPGSGNFVACFFSRQLHRDQARGICSVFFFSGQLQVNTRGDFVCLLLHLISLCFVWKWCLWCCFFSGFCVALCDSCDLVFAFPADSVV